MQNCSRIMREQGYSKRILRLQKGSTGMLKIGKTLGVGTALVQRVVMEQPRPFDVAAAEAALASQ
jgi:hypothetical protein